MVGSGDSSSDPFVQSPDNDAGLDGALSEDGQAGQDTGPGGTTAQTRALLEIYPMDLWAQFLPGDATLSVTRNGVAMTKSGSPVVTVSLDQPGSYEISLSYPEHEDMHVSVDYDGSGDLDGAVLLGGPETARMGLAFSHDMRAVGARELPVHTAYLGLRHKWFSAQGRPARRGNDLTFLADGEQAWSSVAEDLRAAVSSVHISTWWWQSDFELLRDKATHATLTPSERWTNTILGITEVSPAHKRVLVGQFWGQDSILSWMTTDPDLKAYAETPNDHFEFMGMANETEGVFWFEVDPFVFGDRVRSEHAEATGRSFDPEQEIDSTIPPRQVDLTEWPISMEIEAASYHQKFMIVDDEVAYVGGMNLKEVDWDSSKHEVFEFRRMNFDATEAQRQAVIDKKSLPDNGPRKDYMVRIHGPSAQDVADVFHERWMYQIAQGVEYAENSTPFAVQRAIPEQPGGKQVQVTATLPQPFWEHAIAESWFNAVSQAEAYIYIEDQYFRAPMLNDVIVARMQEKPDLRLVVITKPINEWTDPGCYWTYESHKRFETAFPDRYMLLQLRSFDTVVTWGVDETEARWGDIDVHSKMLIVDDKFMSVGSANKNNRGMVYEGELNIAVLDDAWVRDARRRIFANLLPEGTSATDDVSVWWNDLKQAAAWNDAVYERWDAEGGDISLDGAPLPAEYRPEGFLYSMDFPDSSECLIESVGPDMTVRP